MVQQHKIVHISDIIPHAQRILDEMVKLIQIHVRQKLTGKRAQRQPPIARDAA